MKIIISAILFTFVISSCTSFKPITRNQEFTEVDLRTKIVPGKVYQFDLTSNRQIKVKVTKVDSINVYGIEKIISAEGKLQTGPFQDSFEDLKKNTNKVKVKKFDPFLTTGLIAIPVGIMVYSANNIDWVD